MPLRRICTGYSERVSRSISAIYWLTPVDREMISAMPMMPIEPAKGQRDQHPGHGAAPGGGEGPAGHHGHPQPRSRERIRDPHNPLFPLFRGDTRKRQRKFDVFENGLVRNEIIALEYEADRVIAVCIPICAFEFLCGFSADDKGFGVRDREYMISHKFRLISINRTQLCILWYSNYDRI